MNVKNNAGANKYGNKTPSKKEYYIPDEYLKFFDAKDSKSAKMQSLKVDADHVHMLPLGGVGEIGMNAMMYHHQNRWLLVDCGNSFDRLYSQLSHIVVPSVEFIEQRLASFDGIVITHGHQDHIGALPYVWEKLKCPIYTTKFTAILIRRQFEERGFPTDQIIEVELCRWYEIGTFKIKWISVCHSIPGACMVALRTTHGSILHTGDWKIDDKPLLNEQTDFEEIKKLAKEDLHAIISDSTNIMVDGVNPTEEEVGDSLVKLIKKIRKGRVFVTFFSTNISRLYSCIRAAKESGRKIGILGRSLQRSYESAIEAGYIKHEDHVLLEGIEDIPVDQILIACSGSQGEDRSALTRIAKGVHKFIDIGEGDTVIFSCRLIPTNAKEVVTLENALMRRGANVITNSDELVHSSGHARKKDFEQFYALIKENVDRKVWLLPVHGTTMFLQRHAQFAKEHGFLTFAQNETFHDGKLYRICPDVEFVDQIHHDICFLDGKKVISVESPILQERKTLQEGVISVVIVIANGRRLAFTGVNSYGVDEDRQWIEEEVKKVVSNAFSKLDSSAMSLNRLIRSKITNFTRMNLDKQIYIDLHIVNDSHLRRR